MGLLDWLGWRKKPAGDIPEALWQATLQSLPFIAALTVDELTRLRALTVAFLAEKEFSAAPGFELNDEICLAIAVQGCLPILNLGLKAYADWVGIVVYPDEFVVNRQVEDESGIVHEFDDVISGESWSGGPLIVSWQDVQMAGEGYNVVIHEFVHKLDMLNGEADGLPALHSGISEAEWWSVFGPAYDDFCARVDRDQASIIDPYASEHPAEFFAVMSELFFEQPEQVDRAYPALYALLCRYYRQSPLNRATKAATASSTAKG